MKHFASLYLKRKWKRVMFKSWKHKEYYCFCILPTFHLEKLNWCQLFSTHTVLKILKIKIFWPFHRELLKPIFQLTWISCRGGLIWSVKNLKCIFLWNVLINRTVSKDFCGLQIIFIDRASNRTCVFFNSTFSFSILSSKCSAG